MDFRLWFTNKAVKLWKYLIENFREPINGARSIDIVYLFLFIPGILLAIEGAITSNYTVFADITREPMWYELSREHFITPEAIIDLYISNFAHSSWETHLKPNLINYLFCMSALYPVAILADKRDRIIKLHVLLLLLAPIATGVASIYYLDGRTIGFSGILTAYFGLLTVVIFSSVDERIEANFNPFWSVTVILLVYISMLVYFGAFLEAVYLTPIIVLLVGWFIWREGIEGTAMTIEALIGKDNIVIPWAVIIAYFGAFAMYYELPPGSNIIAHLVGYIFGWGIGYFALATGIQPEGMANPMNEGILERLKNSWPPGPNASTIGVLAVITIVIFAVLISVYLDYLSTDTAQLFLTGVLAAATFGYVVLTYRLATAMEDELDHTKEVFKLRRKSDIIAIIENVIDPLQSRLLSQDTAMNANSTGAYDARYRPKGGLYERLVELDPDDSAAPDAAAIPPEVDVSAGDVAKYEHKVFEYSRKYDEAVFELQQVMLEQIDDLPINSNETEDFAIAALALEGLDIQKSRWESAKDDIIPLREEIREEENELVQLKQELTHLGNDLRRELCRAKAELLQEYYISQTELE